MGVCTSKAEAHELLQPYLRFEAPQGQELLGALELVSDSWSLISRGGVDFHKAKESGTIDAFVSPMGHFYTVFYEGLFEAHPETRPLFKSSLKVQGKKLVMMLTTIVGLASAGDLVNLKQATEQLAWRHKAVGVELVQFHFVGECLINTLETCLGTQFDDDLRSAWLTVYCILMSFIIPAYGRKQKPRASASQVLPEPAAAATPAAASSMKQTLTAVGSTQNTQQLHGSQELHRDEGSGESSLDSLKQTAEAAERLRSC